jgi:hypothetical protein
MPMRIGNRPYNIKLAIKISALVASIVTFILCDETINKGHDLIELWWLEHFPRTEILFIPFPWSIMYVEPSTASFIAGLTASTISRSKALSIIICACLGCIYFFCFTYGHSTTLAHALGAILVAFTGFVGHFSGSKLQWHNTATTPDTGERLNR